MATCYPPTGRPFADETRWTARDWERRGNPRVVAAAADDLAAGRVHLGDQVCVQFPGDDDDVVDGDRITYTVRDRCPDPVEVRYLPGCADLSCGCDAGHWDLHVETRTRAVKLGRFDVRITPGRCR